MDPALQSYDCTPGNYFNNTDYENADIEILRNPLHDMLHLIVLPVLMLVGLLFNCAFIYAVKKIPSMQTTTNTYLVNVSCADLIFVIIGGSVILWSRFTSLIQSDAKWLSSGFPGCFCAYFIPYFPYFTSIMLITFVTVERYRAICQPIKHRQTAAKSRTRKFIAASWLIGLVLGAIAVLQFSKYKEVCIIWPEDESFDSMPTRAAYCTALPGFHVVSVLVTVIPFFVALILNIVMYTRIIIVLSKREANPMGRNKSATQQCSVRNQVARLLIVNGTTYFLLQTPFRITSVQNILVDLTGEGILTNNQYHTLLFYGRCMLFVNSLINPLVYVCVSALPSWFS